MKADYKFKLFRIPLWTLPIFLGCGFLIAYLIYPQVFKYPKNLVKIIIYSFIVGIPIMKGYEFIEYKLDQNIPWLVNPAKRLILTFTYQVVYLFVILFLFNLIENYIRYDLSFRITLKNTSIGVIIGVGITIIASLIADMVMFFKNWKKSAVNEEKLKSEKLALEFESLKNQVNPHFLFNSLTALTSLVYKDQDKAAAYIKKLSEVYRYVLEQRHKEVVDLKTELDFINSIFYLYKIRFGKNLTISFEVNPDPDEMIVPMALQMLVENALKHNEISQEKSLSLKIFKDSDYLVVSNSLNPKNTYVTSSKVGLENIKSRYFYLFKKEVIVIKNVDEFIVKLPIIKSVKNEGVDN